jgi:hypothetical protein
MLGISEAGYVDAAADASDTRVLKGLRWSEFENFGTVASLGLEVTSSSGLVTCYIAVRISREHGRR